MDLNKIKKQWNDYNEEFDNSEYMDIDTHTSMALKVGELINRIEQLEGEKQRINKLAYKGLQNHDISALEDIRNITDSE